MLLGISLIIVSVITVQFPRDWVRSAVGSFESLAMASLGLFVLTCGGGITLARISLPNVVSSRPGAADNNAPSPFTLHSGDSSESSSPLVSSFDPRFALGIFLQGCVLLLLYTGLVEEYESNLTMQEWVGSSLASGRFLLNWGALLVSSFLVGVLFVYSLLPGEPAD